jgi:hypothetical protein
MRPACHAARRLVTAAISVACLSAEQTVAFAHDDEPMSPRRALFVWLLFFGTLAWLVTWAALAVRRHRGGGGPTGQSRLAMWLETRIWRWTRPKKRSLPTVPRGASRQVRRATQRKREKLLGISTQDRKSTNRKAPS